MSIKEITIPANNNVIQQSLNNSKLFYSEIIKNETDNTEKEVYHEFRQNEETIFGSIYEGFSNNIEYFVDEKLFSLKRNKGKFRLTTIIKRVNDYKNTVSLRYGEEAGLYKDEFEDEIGYFGYDSCIPYDIEFDNHLICDKDSVSYEDIEEKIQALNNKPNKFYHVIRSGYNVSFCCDNNYVYELLNNVITRFSFNDESQKKMNISKYAGGETFTCLTLSNGKLFAAYSRNKKTGILEIPLNDDTNIKLTSLEIDEGYLFNICVGKEFVYLQYLYNIVVLDNNYDTIEYIEEDNYKLHNTINDCQLFGETLIISTNNYVKVYPCGYNKENSNAIKINCSSCVKTSDGKYILLKKCTPYSICRVLILNDIYKSNSIRNCIRESYNYMFEMYNHFFHYAPNKIIISEDNQVYLCCVNTSKKYFGEYRPPQFVRQFKLIDC